MTWEAFGSREVTPDTGLLPAPHYIVTARCKAGCHAMRHVIDEEAVHAQWWEALMTVVDEAVQRAHPA